MGRRKRYQVPRSPRRRVDLDGVLDTSGTQSNESYGSRGRNVYKQIESVPPPFKGDNGSDYVKRSELSLSWKVAGVVGAVFFSVGIPVVWFASGLSKDVDNLTKEVQEIKGKTDKLLEGSIRSEERLNNAEKSIESIANTLQEKEQRLPNNQVNEDASR